MKRIGAVMVIALGGFFLGCGEAEDAGTGENVDPALSRRCAVHDLSDEQNAATETKIVGDLGPEIEESARPPVGSITVPVYFHVINKGTGLANGDVPDKMIADQFDVIQAAYSKTAFKFTNAGTDRTTNATWYTMSPDSSAERTAKTTLRKGGANALNVYLANPGGGLLGWATFPSDYASDSKMDGVVILAGSVPGGDAVPYDLGDTLTHEAGHWFGLYHTFQGGCRPPGDNVKDTPRVAEPNFGCPERQSVDSCPTPDNEGGPDTVRKDLIENFMDYTDDSCMNTFSGGQRTRAQGMWNSYRN
jgi:hypothetical protein